MQKTTKKKGIPTFADALACSYMAILNGTFGHVMP